MNRSQKRVYHELRKWLFTGGRLGRLRPSGNRPAVDNAVHLMTTIPCPLLTFGAPAPIELRRRCVAERRAPALRTSTVCMPDRCGASTKQNETLARLACTHLKE